MEVLQNMQRMDRRIMEIRNLRKLMDDKLDIDLTVDVGNYMNALANLHILEKKKKNSQLVVSSEELRSCGNKKGRRKSRNSVSSNMGGRGRNNGNRNNKSNGNGGRRDGGRAGGSGGYSGGNGDDNNNRDDRGDRGDREDRDDRDSDEEEKETPKNNDDEDSDKPKKVKNKKEEGESEGADEGGEEASEGVDELTEETRDDAGEVTQTKDLEQIKLLPDIQLLGAPENLNSQMSEEEAMEKTTNIVEDNDIINMINDNASSIREYSFEDTHIKACLLENNTGVQRLSPEEARKIGKNTVSNPFTASSCAGETDEQYVRVESLGDSAVGVINLDECDTMQREEENFASSQFKRYKTEAINKCIQRQQTKIKLNNVLDELMVKNPHHVEYPQGENSEENILYEGDKNNGLERENENSHPHNQQHENYSKNYDQKYSDFIKHYVTNVGNFYRDVAKPQVEKMMNAQSQSFGLRHLYKSAGDSSYGYGSSELNRSLSTCMEDGDTKREMDDCNLTNYLTCSGDKEINRYFEENMNCMATPLAEMKKYMPNHLGYYENFNYSKALESLGNYSCTNAKEYLSNYDCVNSARAFVEENSCGTRLARLTEQVNLENVRKQVNLENVRKHVNMENVRKHVNMENVRKHINMENVRKHVNLPSMVKRINIRSVAERINVEQLKQRLDAEGLLNAQFFDGNYNILGDAYRNYVNKYIEEMKKSLHQQKEHYTQNANCNAHFMNNGFVKLAASNLRNLGQAYFKNRKEFNWNNHKKYIAFHHRKYVGLLDECYKRRVQSVKKKIKVNKEFFDNYFRACTIDCNSNSYMGSNDLSRSAISLFDYGNIEVNSLEQTNSLNIGDMHLPSLFKGSGSSSNLNMVNSSSDSEMVESVYGKSEEGANSRCNRDMATEEGEDAYGDTYENVDVDDEQVNIPCFPQKENRLKHLKSVMADSGGIESDIIYDQKKNIFFDMNDNAYVHVKGNLYFNAKDKLFYEIDYVDDFSYENLRKGFLQMGHFLVTEKYAPCKLIMRLCTQFNSFMYNLLGLRKYNVFYADQENLVEIIIK
ncbi:conserved Plasmodium protein, unknown function [Plasmodium knowlesi strain H]|uniref:Uncharacterized protein n=3 Tax=Plasmodium knowlesi TaxID=5850 RepID=A0A5K1TZS3_PLAKH|nr:conserved Plasmodium protein, unknown function [Plasmodium knowlesi strain H]OTN68141.1 Uncharacterized protein PKNOH_S04348000 [Plasmodium knowlesi]CAA9990207.1 conserved Plasmodium protein, unknown function [Plasmodium knowlesi strain H]SBO27492.1 conserved Plasmodium protein, unknown function [Plasmodium knowlesi strain H]SBO28469.1 conserved Plasmodium protein, unknown function [Plasmodium knowlesi strain H]VVS79681.1 conserved Plasmodium protein, unknown function [Plasmodium knowlesi s|eukprot:XP_002258094.1 hypothetical protein, conserved in Plasmodium species [Plasmodium knowlesi strain H]